MTAILAPFRSFLAPPDVLGVAVVRSDGTVVSGEIRTDAPGIPTEEMRTLLARAALFAFTGRTPAQELPLPGGGSVRIGASPIDRGTALVALALPRLPEREFLPWLERAKRALAGSR